MKDWLKNNNGNNTFFFTAWLLLFYTNNTFFAKNRNVLFFMVPIFIILAVDGYLKHPPKHPKYLIATLIFTLYFIALPKYTTDYAYKVIDENYGSGFYISPSISEQVSSLNPFSDERYYLFLNQNGEQYLFNARTGEVKETKIDIDSK
ncbi:hypothetical protein ACKRLN_08530 [Anaerococcus sp. DFU013_CI05]|uniref:hypothetical protein n=1 Tax=Anaerococcus sp. AH8042_DFU013_CI05 TaxID=3385202 RepID=UPI003A52175B